MKRQLLYVLIFVIVEILLFISKNISITINFIFLLIDSFMWVVIAVATCFFYC
ncbi:hypothetical protein [Fusobacterium polymorphum]|uniref:hypothetical protein n=1 Tax=Fusobacterium nucleatum subsp. polymorphum TaxID=76857 RepID=UPI00164D7A38